jgi:hypothetical protein
MQNAAEGYRQPDGRNENYFSVVSDLVSLIEHIQASMKMLEPVIARASPLGELEAYDDVVVLDDVTPHYVKANTALEACRAGLGVALHCLLDPDTSDKTWISDKAWKSDLAWTSDLAWKSDWA